MLKVVCIEIIFFTRDFKFNDERSKVSFSTSFIVFSRNVLLCDSFMYRVELIKAPGSNCSSKVSKAHNI